MRVALIQLEARLGLELRKRHVLAYGQVARINDVGEDGETKENEAQLTVLPELWAHGAFDPEPWPGSAEPMDGPTPTFMRRIAMSAGPVLHAGSFVERAPDGRYYNTSLVYDYEGELLATYRKIHRFGFDQGEAAFMSPGEEVVTFDVIDKYAGDVYLLKAGLATCYDLRFPELFRKLVDAGAQMVIIPAAWPAKRLDHWRTLLRARAIENQIFVAACAIVGTQAGMAMSGHSMVVDPWGEIVTEGGDGEEIVCADIDPALVEDTRKRFPVLRDRRL